MKTFKEFLEESRTREKQWTAYSVLKNILRGQAWDPEHEKNKALSKVPRKSDIAVDIYNDDWEEKAPKGSYWVSKPWVKHLGMGMFSTMDAKPGEGGAIGLVNPHGTSPEDIAAAAHEAFHALSHKDGLDYTDEKFANDKAHEWLKKNIKDPEFLAKALAVIDHSRKHYGLK